MKLNYMILDINQFINMCLCLLFYHVSYFVSIFLLKNAESSPRSIASRRILQFLGLPTQSKITIF